MFDHFFDLSSSFIIFLLSCRILRLGWVHVFEIPLNIGNWRGFRVCLATLMYLRTFFCHEWYQLVYISSSFRIPTKVFAQIKTFQ
jgi:hypothetical protein